jgi:hypothetical protein
VTQSENLPGVEATKLKFLGVKYQTLAQDFKIGDVHQFTVTGRVKGTGDEEVKDGHIGHVVKLEVTSVTPSSFTEPEDPNQPTLLGADD